MVLHSSYSHCHWAVIHMRLSVRVHVVIFLAKQVLSQGIPKSYSFPTYIPNSSLIPLPRLSTIENVRPLNLHYSLGAINCDYKLRSSTKRQFPTRLRSCASRMQMPSRNYTAAVLHLCSYRRFGQRCKGHIWQL